MKMNWVSPDNILLLNPRLSNEVKARYEFAWKNLVETSFEYQVGIATSGSSGEQGRLIALAKSSLLISAQAVNERLGSNDQDIWLKTLPSFHVGGLQIWARAHLSGASVVESRLEKWEPHAAHAELTQSRATLLSLVPTQLFDLVKAGLKAPTTLRAVVIGGGRLDPELQAKAFALGWPVLPSYGLTECCSQVATAMSPTYQRLAPLHHVDVRIGANDRIEISSASLLTGQVVFDSRMNAHFTDPKIDGWLRTEDCGRLDESGLLTVTGRLQDFVKIGGEGVVLSRLEQQLERLRSASNFTNDAVVLAAQDDRLGAVIVMLSDAEPTILNPLVEQFNSSVMPYERIRTVHRLPAIPRSALGKLLRSQALSLVGLKPVAHD